MLIYYDNNYLDLETRPYANNEPVANNIVATIEIKSELDCLPVSGKDLLVDLDLFKEMSISFVILLLSSIDVVFFSILN